MHLDVQKMIRCLTKMGLLWAAMLVFVSPVLGALRCDDVFKSDLTTNSLSFRWTESEVQKLNAAKNLFIPMFEIMLPLDRPTTGSQGGAWYSSPNRTYFIKTYGGDKSRLLAEHLANKFYTHLGKSDGVAKTSLHLLNGKPSLWSMEIKNAHLSDRESILKSNIHDDFIVDAFLMNWDVIGKDYDNVLLDGNGNSYRVDQGGSLFYRAQGKIKHFSVTVEEIFSMRDPDSDAGRVFSSLSDAEVMGQILRFSQKYSQNHDQLFAEIENSGFAPAVVQKVKHIMDARYAWLMTEGMDRLMRNSKNPLTSHDPETIKTFFKGYLGRDLYNHDYLARIAIMREDSKADLSRLSNEELMALLIYAGGDFTAINDALRNQDRNRHWGWVPATVRNHYQLATYQPIIDLAVQGLKKLPNFRGQVIRIIEIDSSQYQVGKIVEQRAFTSTSGVNGQPPYAGNTLLKISSKHGKHIDFMNVAEDEVLFPPGTKFKVLKRTKDGNGMWIIHLEEAD